MIQESISDIRDSSIASLTGKDKRIRSLLMCFLKPVTKHYCTSADGTKDCLFIFLNSFLSYIDLNDFSFHYYCHLLETGSKKRAEKASYILKGKDISVEPGSECIKFNLQRCNKRMHCLLAIPFKQLIFIWSQTLAACWIWCLL